MKLASTQDRRNEAGFVQAILRCLPSGGGLYQPVSEADLSPWIFHMDESTSFASVAGTLTSALLNEELSPAVCERLAFAAFADSAPALRQLDESLYLLELFHTPTGTHQDFGAMWLASALEHILAIRGETATVFATASRAIARSLGHAFAGKKRLKLVLICAAQAEPAGIPLDSSWLIWNGGNVLPLSVSVSVGEARRLIYAAYSDPEIAERYAPTLANTANIGRLIPQIFFYIFAFSRLKKTVRGDIFYSVPSANYANLVAGLYAWKYSLPVNGFITDSSPMLCCDARGESLCMDFFASAYAAGEGSSREMPSNIKRLEQVFALNPLLLKGFVFPFRVSGSEIPAIQFEARKRHGVWLDGDTAKAFGAAMEFRKAREGGAAVVFANNDPAFELESVRTACGDAPEVSGVVKRTFQEGEARPLSACALEPLKEILAEFLAE